MSYTFIKKRFNDAYTPTPVLAISNEIETLNLADTYDDFGQQVGHSDAGDYSIHNSDYSDAYHDMIKAVRESFSINEDVEFDIDVNDLTATEEIGVNAEELKSFCEKWREDNETFNTVKGFDHWDGHNWKTIVTEIEFGEASHDVVAENEDGMNTAIEDCEFIEDSHGKKYYDSEDFWVVKSAWQGDFESYQLFPKSEYDLDDIKGSY